MSNYQSMGVAKYAFVVVKNDVSYPSFIITRTSFGLQK